MQRSAFGGAMRWFGADGLLLATASLRGVSFAAPERAR